MSDREIIVVRLGDTSHSTSIEVDAPSDSAIRVVDGPYYKAPEVVSLTTGYQHRPGERWWYGDGPPPDLIIGASTGDFYWDRISGDVFELAPTTP